MNTKDILFVMLIILIAICCTGMALAERGII